MLLFEKPAPEESLFGKHPLAVTVNGRDGGAVKAEEGFAQAAPGCLIDFPIGSAVARRFIRRPLITNLPDQRPYPLAQFARRRIGEGNDQDLFDFRLGFDDQVEHQVFQGKGLARASRGLDYRMTLFEFRPGQYLRSWVVSSLHQKPSSPMMSSNNGPKRRFTILTASAAGKGS